MPVEPSKTSFQVLKNQLFFIVMRSKNVV